MMGQEEKTEEEKKQKTKQMKNAEWKTKGRKGQTQACRSDGVCSLSCSCP